MPLTLLPSGPPQIRYNQQKYSRTIVSLLKKGDDFFRQQQFTDPEGNNAFEMYKKILTKTFRRIPEVSSRSHALRGNADRTLRVPCSSRNTTARPELTNPRHFRTPDHLIPTLCKKLFSAVSQENSQAEQICNLFRKAQFEKLCGLRNNDDQRMEVRRSELTAHNFFGNFFG